MTMSPQIYMDADPLDGSAAPDQIPMTQSKQQMSQMPPAPAEDLDVDMASPAEPPSPTARISMTLALGRTSSPAPSRSRHPHRGRSRSLPNLMFHDSAKIHKREPGMPVKALSRRNKKRALPSGLEPSVMASGASALPSADWIQPPPVNTVSLREIDLQEIFKNPQLRHDIVFDPQLQFRPNLDGERGKRKKLMGEKYWDSIVADCEDLIAGRSSTAPRLVLLFNTLREILLSLLPVNNRSHVDSVLDPELLIQQIHHSALDFMGLAKWLSSVFKAHCAPMRDSWVDQMVQRVEMGLVQKSPKRLVEGLRMVFAILEAMKLDVANHQIRTLRPMLVDSAVEFEQEYYNQITSKGKADFTDALVWYKSAVAKFQVAHGDDTQGDVKRSAFIFGLLKLLSCASDDMVSEFPTTFGFDLYRLAGFRAELRKVVCLHLAVSLYQQATQSEIAAAGLPAHEARQLSAACLSTDVINKLKQDILAIISDSAGNTKWTKNTHTLSLEFARRIEEAVHGKPVSVPSDRLVSLCSGWLSKHLQPRSDVYKLLEAKSITNLYQSISSGVAVLSGLDSSVLTNGTISCPIAEGPVSKETLALADRILVLVKFHWAVFGKYYTAYMALSEGELAASSTASTLMLGHTASTVDVKPAAGSTVRGITSGRMRQPSTC